MLLQSYNLRNIRTLLMEGFSAQELRDFAFDLPEFRSVYDQLATSSGKTEIVQLLVEWAERKELIDSLLVWAREHNPTKYAEFQPYGLDDLTNLPPNPTRSAQKPAEKIAEAPASEPVDISQSKANINEPASLSSLNVADTAKGVDTVYVHRDTPSQSSSSSTPSEDVKPRSETELKELLVTLTRNLNILQERSAQIGLNAPVQLFNQIGDHQQAIALIQSKLANEISDEELQAQLGSLNLALDHNGDQRITPTSDNTGEATRSPSPIEPSTETTSEKPEEKIVDGMANDRPKGEDRLGYTAYAKAFAQVLTSKHTSPPLTIGIYAAWGMGKSFLMSKVKAEIEVIQKAYELERRQRPFSIKFKDWLYRRRPVLHTFTPPDEEVSWWRRVYRQLFRWLARPSAEEIDEFLFIDFNAWVYSGSENLWAGLITKLYSEVERYFGQWRTGYFRLGQTFRRSLRRIVSLLVVYGLLAVALSFLLDYSKLQTNFSNLQVSWDSFKAAFTTVAGIAAIIGSALAAALPLFTAIQDLFSSLVLARSEQLRNLSSRRDFRDKIGFMADIKEEISQISSLVKQGYRGRSMRLVIFIDDLDRCPPAKSVDVLEAIMLLLADEDGAPFIVFLGLDARIIVKAIEERYGKVLIEAGITGYEYLDKIVQIPFRIPPAGEEALKEYVNSLLWRSEAERKKAEEAEKQGQLAETDAGEGGVSLPALVESPIVSAERSTIEVSFTKEERDAFAMFTPFLSPNPRRVKRIVNIYRIVRLLEPKVRSECLIKWIILTEQWPYRTAWLMEQIENDFQTSGPFSREIQTPLKQVFEIVKPRVEAKEAQVFTWLDGDRDLFDKFIITEPILSVADVQAVRQFTFNLNPALQEDIFKTAYKIEDNKSSENKQQADGKTVRNRTVSKELSNSHSSDNSSRGTNRKSKISKTQK